MKQVTHPVQSGSERHATSMPMQKVEGHEWWLWGFAVVVTVGLTFGLVSLSFPGPQWAKDQLYFRNLKDTVLGLAGLVLIFDIYSIYQHLQLKRIRRRLWERERLFHLISENAADLIAVVDRDGHRLYNSPMYEKVLGYTGDELASTSSFDQIHPDDRARVIEAAQNAYRTGAGSRLEYRIRHKDGSWRVLESTASVIPGAVGEAEGLVIVNRDITERKQAEALLEHRAYHDGLTNLPNRDLLLDRLQRAIAISRRHPDFKFAVLFLDIDNFKVFNDSLGHAAGDELIIQIARRLTSSIRSSDTVSRGPLPPSSSFSPIADNTLARPGGNEFVVLAAELRDPSDAIRMAKRIQERLTVPFAVNGHEIVVSASIGVAFSGTGLTPEEVLRDAEIAMYRAKHSGKGRCEVFDSAMQAEAVRRLQLETDLRKAFEVDEFRVHYQPIVSLESGQILGFEALTRWQRPQTVIPPGEFIHIANEIGLILPMNRKLLWEACRQLRRWQSQFPVYPPLTISVNVTSTEFAQPDLPAQIENILRQTGVDPRCVIFEITETIAMADADRSLRMLTDLKALGVRLSLDDFGTGFSSLCRLQQFPFDTLKIDRSFISRAVEDANTREIVRIIVLLAHNLGMKVVAEGIEEQQQVEVLTSLGCELGQGYLFSRPADATQIGELLADRARGRGDREATPLVEMQQNGQSTQPCSKTTSPLCEAHS